MTALSPAGVSRSVPQVQQPGRLACFLRIPHGTQDGSVGRRGRRLEQGWPGASGGSTGPNVGGRSAPFFCLRVDSRRAGRHGRRHPAGAEQGGSGLPRRGSTWFGPENVQKRRVRSVAPSLRARWPGRKRFMAFRGGRCRDPVLRSCVPRRQRRAPAGGSGTRGAGAGCRWASRRRFAGDAAPLPPRRVVLAHVP